jgi:alginate O-acetyltransferase complex protein AlgI
MGFTTDTFVFIFLPISILLYLIASQFQRVRLKGILLVAMSLCFYAWSGWNTLMLFCIFSVLVYLLGNLIYYARQTEMGKKKQKKWFRISVAMLVAMLAYYKYLPFALEQINLLTKQSLSLGSLVLPLGISFTVFESISYFTDIYRGDAEPGTFLDAMIFLSLFPKLISGPIVQWKDFQPQLNAQTSSMEDYKSGVDRIIIGFAKKAILADTFGTQIQSIEAGITSTGVDAPTMWLRALLYFFQIYYDFSGYSDIAIGLCRIFGFSLKENFNFPYRSRSITEFWRRWHISLGTWFREYVYIPLGGSRRGNVYMNLFLVFLLTGIWHGANWTFVLWGVLNGILVVVERFIQNKSWYQKIPGVVKWLITMILVFFLWIMFMSTDLSSAVRDYRALFTAVDGSLLNFTWRYYLTKKIVLLLIIAAVGSVVGGNRLREQAKTWCSTTAGSVIQQVCYLVLFVIALLFVINSSYSPFLYFQF